MDAVIRRCLMPRNLERTSDRTQKPLSVPRFIFFPCPPNVALTALQIQAYAQFSTACPVKNPIQLSTQAVAAASLMTCLNMNVLSVVGKV